MRMKDSIDIIGKEHKSDKNIAYNERLIEGEHDNELNGQEFS